MLPFLWGSKASITKSHLHFHFQQMKDFLKTNKLVMVEKQVEIFHKHFEGPCRHVATIKRSDEAINHYVKKTEELRLPVRYIYIYICS